MVLSSHACQAGQVANSLDTDFCIDALQRFVCRRVQVIHIRSDNGTNLIGAKKELHDSLATWGQDRDLGLPWSRDVSRWEMEL